MLACYSALSINLAGFDQPNKIDVDINSILPVATYVLTQYEIASSINNSSLDPDKFVPASVLEKDISGTNIYPVNENISWFPLGDQTSEAKKFVQSTASISVDKANSRVLISSYTNYSIPKKQRLEEYTRLFEQGEVFSRVGYDVIIGGDFNSTGADDREDLSLFLVFLENLLLGRNQSAKEFSKIQELAFERGFVLKTPTSRYNIPRASMDFANEIDYHNPKNIGISDYTPYLKARVKQVFSSTFFIDGIASNNPNFSVINSSLRVSDHTGIIAKICENNSADIELEDFQVRYFNPLHVIIWSFFLASIIFLVSRVKKKQVS